MTHVATIDFSQSIPPPSQSVSSVQVGPAVAGTTPTLPSATTTGNTLVAVMNGNDGVTTFPFVCSDSTWTLGEPWGGATAWGSIWYKQNCGAGETMPTFSSTGAPGSDRWCQAFEFTPCVFVQANNNAGASTPVYLTALDPVAGCLLLGSGYWNGPHAGGHSFVHDFGDSNGYTMAAHLTQSANGFGAYFATAFGTAGRTGNQLHSMRLMNLWVGDTTLGLAMFKPATFVQPPTPTVPPTTLQVGATGATYSQQLFVWDGTPPYTWSLVSGFLPNGLSMSSSGLITGTPTANNTFPFTVKVIDNTGLSTTANLSIQIAPHVAQTSVIGPVGSAPTLYAPSLMDPKLVIPTNGTPGATVSPPGNPYPFVNQNVWGAVAGETQQLTAFNLRNWHIIASVTDPSRAVHCYPDIGLHMDDSVPASLWQNFSYYITGWDIAMDPDQAMVCSAAYDLWYEFTSGVTVNEVMMHFAHRNRGFDFPPNRYATGLGFGGYTVNGIAIPKTYWNLYCTINPASSNNAAFFDICDVNGDPKADTYVGAIDIKAMTQYLVTQGLLLNNSHVAWWSVGFEVCDTQGHNRWFRYNDCWVYAA